MSNVRLREDVRIKLRNDVEDVVLRYLGGTWTGDNWDQRMVDEVVEAVERVVLGRLVVHIE